MKKKLVVNLYGSPHAGKTVAATSLFAQLKKHHVSVELVSEFAKDCVIEENKMALENQLFIWSNQQYKIFCGYKHAQITVTDSPILLGAIYNRDASVSLLSVIVEEYHKYNNFNIFLELDPKHPYSMSGRIHSFTESMSIQNELRDLLEVNDIPYINYNDATEEEIVQLILESIQ
jgi:hypothetical protein